MTTKRDTQEVESFTSEDMTPQTPAPTSQGLQEFTYEELAELSQLDINDVDELTSADKEQLVGTPLFILAWTFKDGDYGPDSEYAFVVVRTPQGLQWFTDGSTGIKQQLKRYQGKLMRDGKWEEFMAGKLGAIKVPRGLRASNYTWQDVDGTDKPGTTYYINNQT